MSVFTTTRPGIHVQLMPRKPSIHVNTQVRVPATLTGGSGLEVIKEDGAWIIQPAWEILTLLTPGITIDPSTKEMWVRDKNTGIYNRLNLNGLGEAVWSSLSSTDVPIGDGSKLFTVTPGKDWPLGTYVIAVSQSDPSKFMVGQVMSYLSTQLTISVPIGAHGGGPSASDWIITHSAVPGIGGGGGGAMPSLLSGHIFVGNASNVATDFGADFVFSNTSHLFTANALNKSQLIAFPSFDGQSYQGGHSILISADGSATGNPTGLVVQVQNTSATPQVGALVALTGGILNQLNGTDGGAVVGYAANSNLVTDSSGAAIWGIARRTGGKGQTTVTGLRATSETGEHAGTADDPLVDGTPASPVADHPYAGVAIGNSTPTNAWVKGVAILSAHSVGLQIGCDFTDSSFGLDSVRTPATPILYLGQSARSSSASISGTTLTVSGAVTGVIEVGSLVYMGGIAANTYVTAFGTGTGGTGTYTVSVSQTVGPLSTIFQAAARFKVQQSGGIYVRPDGSGGELLIDRVGPGNYVGIFPHGSVALAGSQYAIAADGTAADPDLYINRPAGGEIHFKENLGADQVTILPGGNIRIASLDTDLTAPTISGLTKMVICDADGLLSFANIPTGGSGPVDGDKTDITVSGSGATWTIDNDVVTYAKMQNVSAASRLIGRGSAGGAGDPEEITIGANLTMTGTVLSASSGTATIGDGDYTDITVTGSGTIWNIKSGVVTNTELATMATQTIKGRNTAGTGAPEDLSPATVLAMIEAVTPLVSTAEGNAAYAALSHSHTASQISDFAEAVDDRVDALFVDGTNTTVVYNDAANTIQINAAGGGGAPVGASYLVLGLDGTLTSERLFVDGAGLAATDGGAGGNWTLAVGAGTGITVNANDVALTVPVTAILGGTGQTAYVLGDILYSSAANTLAKLAGNTVNAKRFLRQTGTGAVSAAPAWDTVVAADIGSGAALTKGDDTNVTLTLGGTPTTALLTAASITAGWTGTLAVARGGIGVGTITGLMQGNGTGAVTGITNSSTVGQVLRVTGASTYAWGALDLSVAASTTGDLPYSALAQGLARSVLGVTGNAAADVASIQSSAAGQILNSTATTVVWTATPTVTSLTVGNTGLIVGASTPFSDAAGVLTLQGVDALDPTTEATIETAIDTLANLTSIQGLAVTLANAGFDVLRGWDDSAAACKNMLLADILTEASPTTGDFVLLYGAEGDLRKVNWSTLPGAGGGAPTSASYLVVSLDGTLTAERALVAGDGLAVTDGGANGNYTLAVGAGTGLTVAADAIALTIPVLATSGGTGQTVYVIGDLLYASTTTALSKLADVATGNALISGGVGVAPSWGKIDLTAHVTGDLPYANLAQGTARSVLGVTGNATADNASIQSSATGQVLNSTATSVVWTATPTVTSIAATTIELGAAATDTTLSRSAAGVLAVEGVNVLTTATGIASAGTTAAGLTVLTIADPNADRFVMWDDSASTMKAAALADILTEAAPASGDFLLLYGAEGDARKVNWSSLPAGGGGTPAGATTNVQINDGGAFYGDSGFSYLKAPDMLLQLSSGVLPTPGGSAGGVQGGGLNLSIYNPKTAADPSNHRALNVGVVTDSSTTASGFTNESAVNISMTAQHGAGTYNATTISKKTFLPLGAHLEGYGSGQKFAYHFQVNGYGMSDTAMGQGFVNFGGGPIPGDEGQGFHLVQSLKQHAPHPTATVTSVVRSTIAAGITITPAISYATTAQTVAVSATTGINVGDWLVVQQVAPTSDNNMEAVLVTAVGGGTITAIFYCNHPAGSALTAALVLNISGTTYFGQDRVLVNTSGANYSTGTVSAIAGGGFTGTGTSWSNTMVGGTATNVGAIALTADDYLYNGTTNMKSWYQILANPTATGLGIHSYSCAADAGYHGRGPGAGAYIVRPAARILRVSSSVQVICETSAHTWSNGDTVECAVCPYADVTGHQDHMSVWLPGGVRRAWYHVINSGARKFDAGLNISAAGGIGGAGADAVGWGSALQVDSADVGFYVGPAVTTPISILGNGPISWASGTSITPAPTQGGAVITLGVAGSLKGYQGSTGLNSADNRSALSWGGYLHLQGFAGSHGAGIVFGADAAPNVLGSSVEIVYNPEYYNSPKYGEPGLGFTYYDGVGTYGPAGTKYTMMEIGARQTTIGTMGANATSAATNKSSTAFGLATSVWDGSAARFAPVFLAATVGTSVANEPVKFQVKIRHALIPGLEYHEAYPAIPFEVTPAGKVTFGMQVIGTAVPITTATLDPSGLTAVRTYTMPDASGTLALVATSQPLDADLTAIAALTGTNTIYYRSAADTWSPVTIGANLTFTGGNLSASSGTATLGDGTYGDIVVSGSGTVFTVGAAAVDYAAIQDVSAASKLLGRGDSGAGDVQEITLGTNLSMSGTTLNATGGGGGDMLGSVNLAQGAGGVANTNTAVINLNITKRTGVSNTDYTILSTDRFIECTAALTANRTLTLPLATAVNPGQKLDIFLYNPGGFTLFVVRAGAEIIYVPTTTTGQTSISLTGTGSSISLISDGTSWVVIGGTYLAGSGDMVGSVNLAQGAGGVANTNTAVNNLGITKLTVTGDANYTVLSSDRVVECAAVLTADRTYTLPAPTSINAGQGIDFWLYDPGAGFSLIIARNGSESIYGPGHTTPLTNVKIGTVGGTARLVSDGANWILGAGTAAIKSASGIVTLVDAATVALNAAYGSVFQVTAAGNRTVGVPTEPVPGQKIVIMHTASGADRTLALTTGSAGSFRFGTDVTALTATTNGKTDYIGCIYSSVPARWDVVAYSKGY